MTQSKRKPANVLYFRLECTDKKGATIHSKIVKLYNNNEGSATVYPTNFSNSFTVKAQAESAATGYIILSGADGGVRFKQKVNLNKGNNVILIQAPSTLAAGVYTVGGHFTNSLSFRYKLVKQ